MNHTLFKNPPLAFRPVQRAVDLKPTPGLTPTMPYRSLTHAEMARLKELGFGGVVLSVNYHEYLDNESYWQELCGDLEKLRQLGMRVWIRDERGRPSGKAAGKVVARYPAGQARGLAYVAWPVEGARVCEMPIPKGRVVFAGALRWEGDHLSLEGLLRTNPIAQQGMLSVPLPHGRWLIVAFVERLLTEGTFAHDPQSGTEPYINILDESAVRTFTSIAYDAYGEHVGSYLGTLIDGFHTDEPMLITTAFPVESEFPPYPVIPWAEDLPHLFVERYHYDLVSHLPALFNNIGDRTAQVRCDFYRLIGERCGQAYTQILSAWCRAHGVKLKHQPLCEESLVTHTAFNGSLFSFLAPADTLCSDLLSTTVETFKSRDQCLPAMKLVSSVAHVHRRSDVIADFADAYQYRVGITTSCEQIRAAINWMFGLGANALHALWAWRERDAQEWQHLNDYAARLAVMLRGGTHIADLALLYPITTVWAHYVPTTEFLMKPPIGSLERPKIWSETYAAEASAWERPLRELVWTLLEHQRDFDVVDDAALANSRITAGAIGMGN